MPPQQPKPPLRRKATGKLHGEVFDAQALRQLLDEEVPDDVIRHLQKECGSDLTGAIDAYCRLKEQRAQPSDPLIIIDDAERTRSDDDDDEPDPNKRGHICERDQYWDKIRRIWKLKPPTRKSTGLSSGANPHVLFVRRVYSERMVFTHTVIVVRGPVIRNALRNIYRGAHKFQLASDNNAELSDPHFLYWAKKELSVLATHYKERAEKSSLFEIRAALKFIQQEWSQVDLELCSLLPYSINFDYLWAIFPPDCLMVGKDQLGTPTVWRARSHGVSRTESGEVVFNIKAEYMDWNGKLLGLVDQNLRIVGFSGSMAIEDLPFIPLKYHPARDRLMQRIESRSNEKLRFCQKGFKIQEHKGLGLCETNKVEPYTFHGRIIIDPKMMDQVEPKNQLVPVPRRCRNITRAWFSDLASENESPKVLERLLKDSTQVEKEESALGYGEDSDSEYYSNSEVYQGTAKGNGLVECHLTDEEKLLLSGMVYGYSLSDSRWGAFTIDRVKDFKWNSKIFESLVMDPSLKDVILRLVKAQKTGASSFDDFVKGKGKGLIGLLFGPPGSGKTLTAEAIAETAEMPLYMVSSGALGHEVKDLFHNLTRILELATHWKAVLLLDEADVFLARRTMTDLKRNAIVSVFLRELEYYQGILLLTTNQAEIIDDAFQSRIHFCYRYPGLDLAARNQVWRNFVNEVCVSKNVKIDLPAQGIDELARMKLNGRQIKNAMSIAMKLATTDPSRAITAQSITTTAKSLQSFDFAHSDHGRDDQPPKSANIPVRSAIMPLLTASAVLSLVYILKVRTRNSA